MALAAKIINFYFSVVWYVQLYTGTMVTTYVLKLELQSFDYKEIINLEK